MVSLVCNKLNLGQPKRSILGPQFITSDLLPKFATLQKRISSLLHRFPPLSLPFVDQQERILQLWQYKKKVFASVTDQACQIKVIGPSHIHNPLSPSDTGEILCKKLEQIGLRK